MPNLARLRLLPQAARKPAVSIIGMEFGDDGLNAVQLESGRPPRIRARASVAYPEARSRLLSSPAALKSFIRQVLRSGRFSGRRVVTALPGEDTKIQTITYQVRPGQSDDMAIAKLMQEKIGDDLSQFVIDYVPIRAEAREGDRLAMVLMSERSTVLNFLEQLRKAGLSVAALEVSPIAIRRLVSSLVAAEEVPENVLVINAGADRTHLTMISGQRLLFDQQIDFGEESVLSQVSMALDSPRDVAREIIFRQGLYPDMAAQLSDIDDTASSNVVLTIVRPQFANLVAELRRSVLFASSETRGGDIGQVLLIGTIAQWPGAAELLSSLAEMPVSTPRPLPPSDERTEDGMLRPELVIAAGLALRGFDDA